MSAVIVRDLWRRFGATRVLAGLDLTVDDGEQVALTGPNGSGKTTLLRILAGLLRPSAGHVVVFGGTTDDPRTRRRIGIVGHVPPLYLRMTAAENLRFWGRLYDDRQAPDRGARLLEQLGLDPRDRRPTATYSQGMRQRVSIARALSTSPDLLLADEPLAGLDTASATVVAALLAERTLVVATHSPELIAVTRHLALHDGRLQTP